ncbi:relaxase/mobilization nuclease domain-containing protein [Roseobacter litoralis]|uniref:Nuclease-like protein n=1 Tax=Roseobacter litoralis (strain ATCC 49566 / DSM 6996 / JCM 21268 / NBRC 15278 / OCh 149) TaxID=391595 RepID=F7ZJM7_ROSLO|nr:relaxase/mobilization nuclease domain-containing protein [Roseobacter litoralis]AEI93858.1 nuclease-like protein [Roseobacter litoralis Och 149]
MILKGSQRGGAKQLAMHLLRADENEHVELYQIRGFVSDDLVGALKEAQAIAKGTRCKQFLFSVSLNPPENERVDLAFFERAINKIEAENGLTGQPRVIVFHEKNGRRHAHAVWSRIDAETMTARNLPYFKLKLRNVSRQIYFERGWQLPKGLVNSKSRDPRNFTLAEWQQWKRHDLSAKDIKDMVQECWATSDSPKAFSAALHERGFLLARGNRRSHVVVSHHGEVISLPRYLGLKTREVKDRLGDPEPLPDVSEAAQQLAEEIRAGLLRNMLELSKDAQKRKAFLAAKIKRVAEVHIAERVKFDLAVNKRQAQETKERGARLKKGLSGIWQFIKGDRSRLQEQNAKEAVECWNRDRAQRDDLIHAQLRERRVLQRELRKHRQAAVAQLLLLREDRRRFRSPEPEAARDGKKYAEIEHAFNSINEQHDTTKPTRPKLRKRRASSRRQPRPSR